MNREKANTHQTLLACEDHLLELISAGVPLARVLDELCSAVDVQIGNVVSLVFFWDDEEHFRHLVAQDAARCGLYAFYCTAVLSSSEELLGTFEMYCCFPRTPSLRESKLIERATYLAALAIQHHHHEQAPGNFSLSWKGALERISRESPWSKN